MSAEQHNGLSLGVPPELVEAIAGKVAEMVAAKTPEHPDPYMRIEEAAEYLRCPISRIRDLKDQGKLRHYRDGQDPGEPMPYTRRFAAEWCGLTEWQAREGIDELRRLRVIEAVDEFTAGPRSMNLYRPGPGPTTLQRGERTAGRLAKGQP